MDMNSKDANGCQNEHMGGVESMKIKNIVNGEESEANCLLPPVRGGMSRSSDKKRRKVQWNDTNGNKLVEVLEFQPSDASDSDNEDSDTCICAIM